MSTEIILIIVGVVLLASGLLFVIIRRTIRLAIKLMLFGVFVLIIAIGALVMWWYLPGDSGSTFSPASSRTTSSPARRAR